ncbi:4'-phosphopantetheinyl transferase entD [Minicystis rosea]|nr:4'-phosphopantetheinyl transferase entD [Minicystis rosea]
MSLDALADHPHGVVRVVSIPDDTPPTEVLSALLPEEQAFAATLSPLRRGTWVAGRLALASALTSIGAPRTSMLSTPRGAPSLPRGFAGSVSHKRRMAVALAALDTGAGLGVDLEELVAGAHDISRKILTTAELAIVDAGSSQDRFREVLVRFSIKESIYKAVDPFVQRYVGFKEAEVDPGPWSDGIQMARAQLSLEQGEGPFAVEGAWVEIGGHVISSARVRPANG